MNQASNQAPISASLWLTLSSPMRVFVMASAVMVVFVCLAFYLFAQQNISRQASVTKLQADAVATEIDSYFSQLSYIINAAAQDRDLARMPLDIMYFGYARQRLEALVASDQAIVGAFVADDGKYILEGSPIETLGIRSSRINKITKAILQYEDLRPAKPTLYLIPRDEVEFLMPLQSNASSWLLYGAPLVLERDDFVVASAHTGVLWAAIDISSLIAPQLAGTDLMLKGYDVHTVNTRDHVAAADVVASPKTPVAYADKVARLHLYLQSRGGEAWWAFMPWMLLILLAGSIFGMYLFSKREQSLLISATSTLASSDASALSPELRAMKTLLEESAQQSSHISRQLLKEQAEASEIEARESSYRKVAKVLQRRIDEPLLTLSLANSVMQQYSSDRALLPVIEDVQQALEEIQRNSQQLQMALSGELLIGQLKPREIMLDKLLADFYKVCQSQGKAVVFNIDPVLHSRVMLQAEALLEALLATARSKQVDAFGDRFALQLVSLESNDRQQVVRFIFFNDLYQADMYKVSMPEYIPQNPARLTKIKAIAGDLDLRLATIYLQGLQGNCGMLEDEFIGTLLFFDVPMHVLDDDAVMSNLNMNLAKTLRGMQHD